MVQNINDKAVLEEKLKEAGENLVVIDFYATWCGPCKLMATKFEALAATYPEVMFLKVDAEDLEDIAEQYQVTTKPAFVFIKNRKKVDSYVGNNVEKIKETILRHINPI